MRIHEIINELSFQGRPCTKDCSGHKAGYNWAQKKQVTQQTNGPSNSFNNGTAIAVNQAHQKALQSKRHSNELAETGIEELEDIVYPNEFSRAIRQAFKQLYPQAKLKLSSTEEGYVHVTASTLNLYVGASVFDSELTISVSGGLGLVSQGEYPGAVTAMIAAVKNAIVSKYGQPTNTILSVDDDKGHGVWQHIAAKLGMGYEAHS